MREGILCRINSWLLTTGEGRGGEINQSAFVQQNGTVQGSDGSRGMEEKRWMYERIFFLKMTEDYPMA
jgi:hypothetical protein